MFVRACFLLYIACATAHGNSVLPENPECGQQIVDSGTELRRYAKDGEFPWTAVLNYGGQYPYKCVGSLINDRYVLTSSVCVTAPNHKLISVILGVNTLDESPYSEEFGIARVIPHEDFKQSIREFNNDVALIELNDTVKYSDYIKPVCLPKDSSLIKEDDVVIITGWGKNAEGEQVKTKKVVIRRVISNEECREAFAKHNVAIFDTCLCTDSLKDYKDYSCAGDGGAPVVIKREGAWYQEGIISFGSKCGQDFPDGNMRVSKYITWINSHIN